MRSHDGDTSHCPHIDAGSCIWLARVALAVPLLITCPNNIACVYRRYQNPSHVSKAQRATPKLLTKHRALARRNPPPVFISRKGKKRNMLPRQNAHIRTACRRRIQERSSHALLHIDVCHAARDIQLIIGVLDADFLEVLNELCFG